MEVHGIEVEAPGQFLGSINIEPCVGKFVCDKVPHSVNHCGFQLLRKSHRSMHTKSGFGAQET